MRRIRLSSALVALSVFGVVSCSEGTGPVEQMQLDALLLDMNAADAYAASGVAAAGGAPMLPNRSDAPAPCAYQPDTQRFVCPTSTRDGITVDRWFQLLDASGAPLRAFDRAKVAAIRTVTDISGTRDMRGPANMPPMSLTQVSHGDQTMSGLLTNTRTLNGVLEATMTMTSGGTSSSHSMKQTTTDLVLPTERGGYPKSGSIATEMTSPRFLTGEAVTRTVTMTFNGTSIVTMTFTDGDQTTTCQVDLSQRMPMNACFPVAITG